MNRKKKMTIAISVLLGLILLWLNIDNILLYYLLDMKYCPGACWNQFEVGMSEKQVMEQLRINAPLLNENSIHIEDYIRGRSPKFTERVIALSYLDFAISYAFVLTEGNSHEYFLRAVIFTFHGILRKTIRGDDIIEKLSVPNAYIYNKHGPTTSIELIYENEKHENKYITMFYHGNSPFTGISCQDEILNVKNTDWWVSSINFYELIEQPSVLTGNTPTEIIYLNELPPC